MTAESVIIGRGDPASAAGDEMLRRYFSELAERFPGGFDIAEAAAAPLDEFLEPSGAFLVACLDDRPIGCGALRRLHDDGGEIKRMWIDPEARGQGVGRRLLRALEDTARELGYTTVYLDTSSHLPEAIHLYRSQGYKEIAAYNDNPYAAHWFAKSLSRSLGNEPATL